MDTMRYNCFDFFSNQTILVIRLTIKLITFKNIEDIPIIINKYNNSIPTQISVLNPTELKLLKIMTKE